MDTFEVNDAYECDVATLHEILTSAEYLQAKFPAIGFRDVVVLAASPTDVTVRRTITAPLPAFAKRVLGEDQVITQVEKWAAEAGEVAGTFTASAQGTPVTIAGTIRITPQELGCLLTITGRAACKVPLIGGKIAGIAASAAREVLLQERDFTTGWVATHT